MIKALIYAYVLGGLTFLPLVILAILFVAVYTSVPVGDGDPEKKRRKELESRLSEVNGTDGLEEQPRALTFLEINDLPKTKKGWLTMRHTFEESLGDGGYVNLVRSFLDSRSKDPKKSRPKDMWYVVLKGKILYLYEDEDMTDCEAVVELGGHGVFVYPEGQTDGEMFAKRNAICLRPKSASVDRALPTLTKEMKLQGEDVDVVLNSNHLSGKQQEQEQEQEREKLVEDEKRRAAAKDKEMDTPAPWFIFVRSNVEMEDWYLALIHASDHPTQTPTLSPLQAVFQSADMDHLVSTLDEQPDVIPMRWLNALIGRVFFSYYRTHTLESYIISRLMKKLSKVKRPAFLTDVVVTEVSVGNRPPTFSKPMLKELTKEGDASLEVHLQYKGEIRITIEATAIINLGQFKSYNVKLVLAAVLKELDGNLLIKVKRPPSNRIWYAFTQSPRMVLQVEPIVSDRQIKWSMILSTIESKLKEIIQESVVMPNMDDIAFFESSSYRHRGGIWSDASRFEKPIPVPSPETTGSAPPILESGPSSPGLPSVSSIVSDAPEYENGESRPASVIPIVHDQDVSMKESDPSILKDRSQSEPLFVDEERGQSSTIRPMIQSSSDILPEVCEPFDSFMDGPALETPLSHSRKSSVRSAKSHSSARSTDSIPEPLTPRKSSDISRDSHPSPSPSSFLSTLKSKAGDKQALSNTARETMRKWGVNWSSLKKEFSSEENGDLASKLRSKMENVSNKRDSYAEVRAAVADRREREHSAEKEKGGGSGRSTSPLPPAENSSSEDAARVENGSPLNVPSISQQTGKRSITPVLASNKSLPSVSRVNTDIDATDDISEDEIRHVPIQAQPQAKTMTIPGIHASHRGEVMSMGYVVPQPSLLSDTIKSKNPAIQSVYRLWRNPSNTGEDTDMSESVKQIDTFSAIAEADSSEPQLLQSPPVQAPPPLPPRPTSGAPFRPRGQDQSGEPSTKPMKVEGDAAPSDKPMASLSDEVTLNATIMSSATTSTTDTPPPLPPRRISSTA